MGEYEVKLTHTRNTSVTVYPCGAGRQFGHGSLATPDHLEAGDQPGQKSRRTMGSEPRGGQPYQRALDDDQPGVPATDDFGGLGEGGALCQDRVKHGRSCRTFSTTHPEAAPATVTCSYIVGWHRWTLGWGNLVQAPQALRHETTRRRRCQAPAPRACHPEGVRGHRGATGVLPWAGWG